MTNSFLIGEYMQKTYNRTHFQAVQAIVEARLTQSKDPSKRFLTVSEETARVWAIKLGAQCVSNTKSYFVDGHEREDVVYHRNVLWLPQEKELELRQYLWVQKPQDEILQHLPSLCQTMINAGMVETPLPKQVPVQVDNHAGTSTSQVSNACGDDDVSKYKKQTRTNCSSCN